LLRAKPGSEANIPHLCIRNNPEEQTVMADWNQSEEKKVAPTAELRARKIA